MVITKQTERTHADNAVRYGTEVSDRKETEMGKTFVEDERPCDSCVNRTRYGCVSWNCEYINRDEAIKAWREKNEKAERKTENCSEIPNNLTTEDCSMVEDEPQTEEYDFRDEQEYNDRWQTDCCWGEPKDE